MSTETTSKPSHKVAIIIGSQRVVRICPEVSRFVLDVIKNHHSSSRPDIELTLELLDIAKFDLPLTDEPGLPAHITDRPAGYTTEKTRAWSQAVDAFDAFVFVTPQYNWGMPAALKNAIDHVFNEWAGKPAMVVSYGGQAGTLSAAQLITVLSGVFMQVVKKPVCMRFGDPSVLKRAVSGDSLGLDAQGESGLWSDEKSKIVDAWEKMLGLLREGNIRPPIRSLGLAELWEETVGSMPDFERQLGRAK